MNIQRKNSAHHFRMQSEREQTLIECARSNRGNMVCFVLQVNNKYKYM